MEIVGPVLGQFVVQLPLLLVYIAGLVLAVARWQQHRRVSLIALIAIALLLFDLIVGTFTAILPTVLLSRYDWSASQIGTVFAVSGIIRSVIVAVAFGLLLWAIFGWRKQGTPV